MKQDRIRCGVEATVGVVSGKWKPLILHHLFYEGTQRFNALLRKTGAPRQALTVQLRELERDGVLSREVFAQVPPRVEYSLTELGRALGPVLLGMLQWGERFQAAQGQAQPEAAEPEPQSEPAPRKVARSAADGARPGARGAGRR